MLSMSGRIMSDITESTINCTENTITHYSLSCEFILMCVNTHGFFVLWKPWKVEILRVTGMQGNREINNMDLEIYIETDEILTFTYLWNNWCSLACPGHPRSIDQEVPSENAIKLGRFDLFLVNPCWPVPTFLFFSFLEMTSMQLQCYVMLCYWYQSVKPI